MSATESHFRLTAWFIGKDKITDTMQRVSAGFGTLQKDAAATLGVINSYSMMSSAMARAGRSILRFSGGAIDSFAALETELIFTAKVMDKTIDVVPALEQAVLGIANAVPIATQKIGEMGSFLSQMGISQVGHFDAMLGVVSKTALATRVPAKQLSLMFGKLTKIYDLASGSAEDLKKKATSLASSLVYVSNNTADVATKISDMTTRFAAVAKTIGILPQQAMAFSALLVNNAVRAKMGASNLLRLFTAMKKKTAEMASEAGIKLSSFQAHLDRAMKEPGHGARVVLGWLHAMRMQFESNPKGLSAAIERLFGSSVHMEEALTILITKTAELNHVLIQSQKAYEEGTQLQNALALISMSYTSKLQMLANAWTVLKIKIASALKPVLVPLLSILTLMVKVISLIPTPILGVIGVMTVWAGVSAIIAAKFTLMSLVFGNFGGALGVAATAARSFLGTMIKVMTFGAMGGDILTKGRTANAAILAKDLIAGKRALAKAASFSVGNSPLPQSTHAASLMKMKYQNEALLAQAGIFTKLKVKAVLFADALKTSRITKAIGGIGKYLKAGLNSYPVPNKAYFEAAALPFVTLGKEIKSSFIKTSKTLAPFIHNFGRAFSDIWAKLGISEKIGKFITKPFGKIVGAFSGLWTKMGIGKNFNQFIAKPFSAGISLLASGVGKTISMFGSALKSGFDLAMRGVGHVFFSLFANLHQLFSKGFSAFAKEIGHGAIGIFKGIGPAISSAYNYLNQQSGILFMHMSEGMNTLYSSMVNGWKKFQSKMTDVALSFSSGFTSAYGKISNKFFKLIDSMLQGVVSISKMGIDAGKAIYGGISSGIGQSSSIFKNFAKSVGNATSALYRVLFKGAAFRFAFPKMGRYWSALGHSATRAMNTLSQLSMRLIQNNYKAFFSQTSDILKSGAKRIAKTFTNIKFGNFRQRLGTLFGPFLDMLIKAKSRIKNLSITSIISDGWKSLVAQAQLLRLSLSSTQKLKALSAMDAGTVGITANITKLGSKVLSIGKSFLSIAGTIMMVAGLVYFLYSNWEKLKTAMSPSSNISSQWAKTWGEIVVAFDNVKKAVLDVLIFISDTIADALGLEKASTDAGNFAGIIVVAIRSIGWAVVKVLEVFTLAAKILGPIIVLMMYPFIAVYNIVMGILRMLNGDFLGGLGQLAKGIWQWFVAPIIKTISIAFNAVAWFINMFTGGALTGLIAYFNKAFDSVASGKILSDIGQLFSNLASIIWDWGKILFEYITAPFVWAWNKITGIWSAITGFFSSKKKIDVVANVKNNGEEIKLVDNTPKLKDGGIVGGNDAKFVTVGEGPNPEGIFPLVGSVLSKLFGTSSIIAAIEAGSDILDKIHYLFKDKGAKVAVSANLGSVASGIAQASSSSSRLLASSLETANNIGELLVNATHTSKLMNTLISGINALTTSQSKFKATVILPKEKARKQDKVGDLSKSKTEDTAVADTELAIEQNKIFKNLFSSLVTLDSMTSSISSSFRSFSSKIDGLKKDLTLFSLVMQQCLPSLSNALKNIIIVLEKTNLSRLDKIISNKTNEKSIISDVGTKKNPSIGLQSPINVVSVNTSLEQDKTFTKLIASLSTLEYSVSSVKYTFKSLDSGLSEVKRTIVSFVSTIIQNISLLTKSFASIIPQKNKGISNDSIPGLLTKKNVDTYDSLDKDRKFKIFSVYLSLFEESIQSVKFNFRQLIPTIKEARQSIDSFASLIMQSMPLLTKSFGHILPAKDAIQKPKDITGLPTQKAMGIDALDQNKVFRNLLTNFESLSTKTNSMSVEFNKLSAKLVLAITDVHDFSIAIKQTIPLLSKTFDAVRLFLKNANISRLKEGVTTGVETSVIPDRDTALKQKKVGDMPMSKKIGTEMVLDQDKVFRVILTAFDSLTTKIGAMVRYFDKLSSKLVAARMDMGEFSTVITHNIPLLVKAFGTISSLFKKSDTTISSTPALLSPDFFNVPDQTQSNTYDFNAAVTKITNIMTGIETARKTMFYNLINELKVVNTSSEKITLTLKSIASTLTTLVANINKSLLKLMPIDGKVIKERIKTSMNTMLEPLLNPKQENAFSSDSRTQTDFNLYSERDLKQTFINTSAFLSDFEAKTAMEVTNMGIKASDLFSDVTDSLMGETIKIINNMTDTNKITSRDFKTLVKNNDKSSSFENEKSFFNKNIERFNIMKDNNFKVVTDNNTMKSELVKVMGEKTFYQKTTENNVVPFYGNSQPDVSLAKAEAVLLPVVDTKNYVMANHPTNNSSNDAVVSLLKDLISSIKDLGNNNNNAEAINPTEISIPVNINLDGDTLKQVFMKESLDVILRDGNSLDFNFSGVG